MADSPYETGLMSHYLDFVFPDLGKIEIGEPVKFDAFSYNLVQANGRFGRDKSIGAKDIPLIFRKTYAKKVNFERTQFNGTVVSHLTHCFDEIIEALRRYGSEVEVRYIVSVDGEEFVNGILNLPDAKIGFESIECNVVQDTTKAMLERKDEIKIDVFSSVDTFKNPITPLARQKMLLKAVPFYQVSEWKFPYSSEKTISRTGDNFSFHYSSQVVTSGIENALPFIDGVQPARFFRFVEAENEMTNVRISITNIDVTKLSGGNSRMSIRWGLDFTEAADTEVDLLTRSSSQNGVDGKFGTEAFITIPVLRKGYGIWIRFVAEGITQPNPGIFKVRNTGDIKIEGISRAYDSVIDVVAYPDFFKQIVKSACTLPTSMPEWETGRWANQYVFNKTMIRQIPNAPFYGVFRDEANDLAELNADYQITDSGIEVLPFTDFYPNVEIGVFEDELDSSIQTTFNERFKKFLMTYGYETFEQDKDEKNTSYAFNTELQRQLPNDKINDKLEVKIKKVRDAYAIETARKESFNLNTSTSNDDKVFIVDAISLPPGTKRKIRGVFTVKVEGDFSISIASDGNPNWTTLGLQNGQTAIFKEFNNQILNFGTTEVAVLQQTSTVLELTSLGFPFQEDITDEMEIELEYVVTGVALTNRTNEGFTLVNNIIGAEFISNIRYSPGRNLDDPSWSSYLHTICADREDGVIDTTYFKSNGSLTTQFQGGKIIREDGDVLVSELAPKILSKYQHKVRLKIPFYTAKKLIEDTVNIKGFIRVLVPSYEENFPTRVVKMHLKDMDSNWKSEIFEGVGEERFESDFIDIVGVGSGKIDVTSVGYQPQLNKELDWHKIVNGYVQIFDNDSRPLINPTWFERIKVNGISYTDVIEFETALVSL